MKVVARVRNTESIHEVAVETDGKKTVLPIPAKTTGRGSAVNGGELLMLALATCFCNDIFREAALRGIDVQGVEVEAEGEFPASGHPASNIQYRAHVVATGSDEEIKELIRHTDGVAEVHLTVRRGLAVTLAE